MSQQSISQELLDVREQVVAHGELRPVTSAAPARRESRVVTLVRDRLIPLCILRVERLGRLGFTGAALLIVGITLSLTVNGPLRQRVEELRVELTGLEQSQRTSGSPVADSGVRAFVAKLPTRADLPVVIAAMLQQARESHLELERGNYELVAGKTGAVAQYRIAFPVRGAYPDVRRFIEAALVAVPAAAVESLRLERDSIAEPQVSAAVQFVVFVRSES